MFVAPEGPATQSDALTIEKVNAFAAKFVPTLERSERASWAKFENDHKSPYNVETTIKLKLESTDLKRTDSLVNPIVGEIVFTNDNSSEINWIIDRFTVTFSYTAGKFALIGGKDECVQDRWLGIGDEPKDNRTGRVDNIAPGCWQDEIVTAQQTDAERIGNLLSIAQTNDSKLHGRDAITALDELLELDPQNADALALRKKISGYYKFANTVGMVLVKIEPGEFFMGSRVDEPGRQDSETPHGVTLTKGFFMASTPVTQAQWMAVMGNDPSQFHGAMLPVEQVSWNDAVTFCSKLSQVEGRHYRLPTEAEWEYACRAGTQTTYYFGDDAGQLGDYAWYLSNSGQQTHPVGQKKPNAWGLYDMLGNVWEWCNDNSASGDYPDGDATDPKGVDNGQYREIRGGSFGREPTFCRCAMRANSPPATKGQAIGFRVVLDAD